MQLPEFTCLCPKTGQPDFATLDLEYVPDRLCVELKSLKLYIWSFRDRGAFHEAVTNEIADRLTPLWIRVSCASRPALMSAAGSTPRSSSSDDRPLAAASGCNAHLSINHGHVGLGRIIPRPL